jgi:hypothetical protein
MATGKAGKFKVLFRDLTKSVQKLWLEMMGALFLALAVMFTLSTFSSYRKIGQAFRNWDFRTEFTIVASAIFSFLMLVFSLQCFWKARKMR